VLERQGERIAIQCKHWKSWNVGVKVVREMIGAMTVEGLQKGIIVSLKGCTAEARELAGRQNIELVEEGGLVALLKYLDSAEVQGILSDRRKVCPRCEREMILRTARKGAKEGGQFWGCSGFPGCRQTMPFEALIKASSPAAPC
jgi:restriction system protein